MRRTPFADRRRPSWTRRESCGPSGGCAAGGLHRPAGLPRRQLVEPRRHPRAGRFRFAGSHRLDRTPENPTARRRCIPTSGRRPTGFRMSACRATSRCLVISSSTIPERAIPGARASARLPGPGRGADAAELHRGGVPGGGDDGDRHMLSHRPRPLAPLRDLGHPLERRPLQRWEAGSGAVCNLATNDRRPEGGPRPTPRDWPSSRDWSATTRPTARRR